MYLRFRLENFWLQWERRSLYPFDPNAVNRISLKAGIKGDTKNISVSDGVLDMDESKVNFTIKAGDFAKPRIAFNMDLESDRPGSSTCRRPAKEAKPEKKKPRLLNLKGLKRPIIQSYAGILERHNSASENLKIKNAKIERVHLNPHR